MDSTTSRRAIDRSRAVRRLRTLTLGTAVAGAVATTGFGWLAAMSDAGSDSAAVIAADGVTTADAERNADPSSAATPTPTISSSTSVSGSTGGADVSTGGS